MTVGEYVTADDLVDLLGPEEPRVEQLFWNYDLDRLADGIGRLRRRHPDADDYDRILLDRAAGLLDWIDIGLKPCAADLVGAGFDVHEALELIDRHVAELWSRMGGRP